MRAVILGFWTSNVLLVAASGAFAWTRAHAPLPTTVPGPAVRVVSFRPGELSESAVLTPEGLRPGWVSFRVAAGETVVGIAGARAFPVEAGVPALRNGVELAAAQVDRCIDARQWLRQDGVPPEVFLKYDLTVVGPTGAEECRQGWTRFDVTSLRTSGLSIEAPEKGRVTIDVRTAEGQAVPGALLVVDPIDVPQRGLASQFTQTSDDGTVLLSGLDHGVKYRVSLADGVGPDSRAVAAVVTGDGSRQELRVALPGKWEFVRHHLHFVLAGSSTRVIEIQLMDVACPGAWAVDRWIPPGRGLDAPFWVMFPATDAPRAAPAKLVFANREAVEVSDLRRPRRLVFSPFTHDVKLMGEACDVAAKPSPHASSTPR